MRQEPRRSALPPGPAQLTVVKDGFLPATVDITVGDARAAGHRRADRAARSRRRGGGRRHHPHRPPARRSADPRRGPRPRGDRREDADDARRHRHDAERDGRPAGAGDVALDRRRQRARAGHEGPLHALPERRAAALRPAGRRARAAADPADGSRPGRGDQGHGLGALRRRRDGRGGQSAVAAPGPCGGDRRARQPVVAGRRRWRRLRRRAARRALERVAAGQRPRPVAQRSRRRWLGRRRRLSPAGSCGRGCSGTAATADRGS